MDKAKERGILKLEPRARVSIDTRPELTPQGSYDQGPASPQPSVDRLSVTWADPGSMASSGANEVKFSPSAGECSDDEDYSASLSAVLRQRRASVRRSRKGRSRRPSSPFLAEEVRRRSSVFTTSSGELASMRKGREGRRSSSPLPEQLRRESSVFTYSGDTAISMEEVQSAVVTQEQIFENIHIHKEVLSSVKQEPIEMRRKLKIVNQAKAYIKQHEGQLQQRLAQSKSTKDIYARFNILLTTKWQQLKREAANTSNLLIPWELRIKEIESHFGSVVASYFTFLRWLFWVNLVIGFILLVFVIVPEYLTADPKQDGQRKNIEDTENATNLLTLWEFEGVLKYSPIFYGYYSNIVRPQYAMPLAYFLTGLGVYIYSFVAILRNDGNAIRVSFYKRSKHAMLLLSYFVHVWLLECMACSLIWFKYRMAENSRMSKLSEKEDECIFSWKLFTGWDFMIGNAETAHNRIASVILGFKEALLEEAEKKKNLRNWRILSLRGVVNICVILLLVVSAYAVVTVVSHSDDNPKVRSWWRENETTIVVTLISITFPVLFELLGLLEHYHPRKQLRLQLARIMLLNLLNLYSLIFALFTKIGGMSNDLTALKPAFISNSTLESNVTFNVTEPMLHLPTSCHEEIVACEICNDMFSMSMTTPIFKKFPKSTDLLTLHWSKSKEIHPKTQPIINARNDPLRDVNHYPKAENLIQTTRRSIIQEELEKLRSIVGKTDEIQDIEDTTSDLYDEYSTVDEINNTFSTDALPVNSFRDYIYNTTSTDVTIDDNNITQESINDITNIYITNVNFSQSSIDDQYSTMPNEITYDWISNENSSEWSLDNRTSYDWMSNNDSSSKTTNTIIDTEISLSTYASYTELNGDTTSLKDLPVTNASPDYMTEDEFTTGFDAKQTTTEKYSYTDFSTDIVSSTESTSICPNYLNCSLTCDGHNITRVFIIDNCKIVARLCYRTTCRYIEPIDKNKTLEVKDVVYLDSHNRKMYNLTDATKKKLEKLCWETLFGQELVKLTMMDLVFVLLGTLFMDFFRALFVRYMNRCWCWDLEKKFPEYGDFKIAENILHLINNQGMVWMGMFFSPGLVVLNVVKLMVMMYLRSWAVMTCNVPHEVVFRVSKSNNFYLALLLTMLFLCVLPVGYAIVWVRPSWHCGPFSEYEKIYHILTNNIYKILPETLNFPLEYIASPAIVIPLLVLLILIIYYLISLTNSLREANNDLKTQLRRERTEERRKMFKLADTRVRAGSSAMDNTPFSRWKKALPSLPLRSIDSDENKTITADGTMEPQKFTKKKGGILAKIVAMAVDKKPDVEALSDNKNGSTVLKNINDDSDTDFHEVLPKEVLTIKDIVFKSTPIKKKGSVEFKTDDIEKAKFKIEDKGLKVKLETIDDRTEKKAVIEKQNEYRIKHEKQSKPKLDESSFEDHQYPPQIDKKISKKQPSESSNQSKQSDSIGSVIPVITISTTESDEELLQSKHDTIEKRKGDNSTDSDSIAECLKKIKKSSSDLKSLRRQSSVESINEQKLPKDKKPDDGHKYQYSL